MIWTYFVSWVLIGLLFEGPSKIKGHGFMYEPLMRSSLWRTGKGPLNLNDNDLSCGGPEYQWKLHNGRCGVCGDPYGAKIKPNEDKNGRYVTNTIVAKYKEGDVLTARINLTSCFNGWFEFRVCPLNSEDDMVNQTCLDERLLPLASNGKTRYHVGETYHTDGPSRHYSVPLLLPPGLSCSHCVLQWWFKTALIFGEDKLSSKVCQGCGPQLTFVNCADIEIEKSSRDNEIDGIPVDEDNDPVPGVDDHLSPIVEFDTIPPSTVGTVTFTGSTDSPTTDTNTQTTADEFSTPTVTTSQTTEEESFTTTESMAGRGSPFVDCSEIKEFKLCNSDVVLAMRSLNLLNDLDDVCCNQCPKVCPLDFCKCSKEMLKKPSDMKDSYKVPPKKFSDKRFF